MESEVVPSKKETKRDGRTNHREEEERKKKRTKEARGEKRTERQSGREKGKDHDDNDDNDDERRRISGTTRLGPQRASSSAPTNRQVPIQPICLVQSSDKHNDTHKESISSRTTTRSSQSINTESNNVWRHPIRTLCTGRWRHARSSWSCRRRGHYETIRDPRSRKGLRCQGYKKGVPAAFPIAPPRQGR